MGRDDTSLRSPPNAAPPSDSTQRGGEFVVGNLEEIRTAVVQWQHHAALTVLPFLVEM